MAQPLPYFLGICPLDLALQLVCGVHFLQCIFFVGTTSSVATVSIFAFEFSPRFQTVLGAWHLLGIAIIAGAFVGARRAQELPLTAYAYYLLANSLAWLVITFVMVKDGRSCSMLTQTGQSQRVGVSFVCGLITSLVFLALLTIAFLSAYSCFAAWMLVGYLQQREDGPGKQTDHEGVPLKAARQGRRLSGLTSFEHGTY
mmetsp:Transcript_46380/g.92000  ORF Transcript_46380/g.92000 Transcript_46380/m.92000 type:complete len:200 (+) Transcript_46380:110-709(+)